MKILTIAEVGKIMHYSGADKLMSVLPLTVIVRDKPAFVIDKVGEVICLSDMHPRMKNMIRAMENRARMGMPKVERVDLEQLAKDAAKDSDDIPF